MELIVVGAGWAGERHVRAIKALESEGADAHVAALVDVDRERLAGKRAAWGIEAAHADLPSALDAHPDAGAVVLATPHHLHRRGTELAAAAGRHVLVEKPMALILEDADAMIGACERAGTTLMVAESKRYQRASGIAREAVASGKIGRVLSGRVDFIGRGRHTYTYPGRRAWLADPEVCGGGIWMLNGVHDMSAARMLLGEVTRIDAREVHSDAFESGLEATVVALVEFASGAVITMTVSAELHGYRRFGGMVLFGNEGTIELGRHTSGEVRTYTGDDPEIIDCAEEERAGAPGHFVRQMEEFLASIAEKREPFTSGPCERATLAAILAGYESIRTGMPVAP